MSGYVVLQVCEKLVSDEWQTVKQIDRGIFSREEALQEILCIASRLQDAGLGKVGLFRGAEGWQGVYLHTEGKFAAAVIMWPQDGPDLMDAQNFPTTEEQAFAEMHYAVWSRFVFVVPVVPREQDDKNECKMCLGTGTHRPTGNPCLNCKGSGLEPKFNREYHAASPKMNLKESFPSHTSQKDDSTPSTAPETVSGDSGVLLPAIKGLSLRIGTFTVVMEGEHITLRVEVCDSGNLKGKTIVSFLSGPDNTRDFTGFAFWNQERESLAMWKKFADNQKLKQAVYAILNDQIGAGEAYALESGNCFLCNRKLTVPASLHRGMGPICSEKWR